MKRPAMTIKTAVKFFILTSLLWTVSMSFNGCASNIRQPDSAMQTGGESGEGADKAPKLSWIEKAEIAADTLLDERGRLVLEGKIALYNLELLRELEDRLLKEKRFDKLEECFQLEEKFINIVRKVELAQLTTFDSQTWRNLENRYKNEKDSLLTVVDELLDSLILAYDPIFKIGLGDALMRKVEDRDKLKRDYIYRIGVLHLEYAELKYQRESEQWDNLSDSVALLPDSLRREAELRLPPLPCKDYFEAIANFEFILRGYPGSDYEDDAFYNLAYIKIQSNDDRMYSEGMDMLHRFPRKFPDSPYIPNVEMRLGQYYLEIAEPDFDKAIAHFSEVLNYPDSEEYENAMYRLGWCYYQNEEYPKAIKYLSDAVDQGLGNLARGKYSHQVEESIENLSKSFTADTSAADMGLDPAVDYLKDNPQRLNLLGTKMLNLVGDIFQNDYGAYMQAVAAYDTLLTEFPYDSAAPEIHKKLVKCYELMGDKDKVLEEKYEIFQKYNYRSRWVRAQSNEETAKQANRLAEKSLREVLRESTLRSEQSKQREDLIHTLDLCRTYIDYYPNTTETYRINYNLAIILTLDLKDYETAYKENINITRQYPEGKYHETCASNAVECARLLMEEDASVPEYSRMNLNVPPEVIREIPYLGDNPLTNAEILYLISLQNYISLYPVGKKADIYMYNAGILYFKHQKFEASRHYLVKLVYDYPQSPKYDDAYKHIMEGYFLEGDYENSERLAREIIAGNFSEELVKLASARISESIFSHAKTVANKQDFIKSGMEFKRVALETPKFEYAGESLWEAGIQFRKGAAYDSAIVALELLVQRYPDSEWADKSLNNIAFIYMEDLKQHHYAAVAFERLYNQYPKSEFAQISLTNASYNFIEAQEFTSAIRVNEKYLQAYPKAEDGREVQYENAQLYLRLNQLNRAISSFEAFSKNYPDDLRNVRAGYEVGKYYFEQGNRQLAKQYFESAVAAHRRSLGKEEEGFPKYASFSLYQLLEWDFSDYLSINYSPLSQVDAKRRQKLSLKTELDSDYRELISYRQKEAVTAYYRLCQVDEDFARAELQQAMPSLAGDDLIAFRSAILDSAVYLYVSAAQSYYYALKEVANWEQALIVQREELDRKLAEMMQFKDEAGTLPPDSQRVYMVDLELMEDIQESIIASAEIQKQCRNKVAQIYLNNPRLVSEILDRIVKLPDQGSGYQEKMFYRERIITEAAMPAALNLIELYRQADVVTDTINVAQAYSDSAKNEMLASITRVMNEYAKLVEDQALARFRINLNSFKQRVDKLDYDALNLFSAPLVYLDIADAVMDSMVVNSMSFLNVAHSQDYPGMPVEALDSLYSAYAYNNLRRYKMVIAEAEKYKAECDRKFEQNGEDIYLDGMDLAENIISDASVYCLEYLELAIRGIENYSLHNKNANLIIRALVEMDPFNYGHLMGISFESQFVYSNTNWRVANSAPSDFTAPGCNDTKWENAILVQSSLPEYSPLQDKPKYLHTDSAGIAAIIQLPVDSLAIDTTFKFVIDSMDIDTMIYIFGDTIRIDTTIYRGSGDTVAVDTIIYLPGDSIWVDTSFVQLSPGVDSVAIDTTMRIPVDTIVVDTFLYLFEEDRIVDTTFYSIEYRDVDTTIYRRIGGVPVETRVQSRIKVPGEPIPLDTTIFIRSERTPVDTIILRMTKDTLLDTTIRRYEYLEVDSTIYRITDWRRADTTLYHYTDSVKVEMLDLSKLHSLGAQPIWSGSPAKKLYFRYKFDIVGKPIFGSLICSVDETYNLYLNGQFVAQGPLSKDAWIDPMSMNVVNFLQEGLNTIAVEAVDEDLSANGLWFRLEYNVLPDDFEEIPVVRDPNSTPQGR